MASRVVIVTGGGRGIGRDACLRFASAGDRVVCAARTPSQLQETRALIQERGGQCITLAADLACGDDIQSLIQQSHEHFGRIDVLVNCAGVAVKEPVEQMEEEAFATMRAVNITGIFLACKYVWPVMRAHGGGVIVNVSSLAAFDPFPGFASYGASKAWVNAFTYGLAEEGRHLNIRVFAVAPGAVATQMLRNTFPDFPMEKALAPSDVAETIFALADPAWSHATGQVIRVKK